MRRVVIETPRVAAARAFSRRSARSRQMPSTHTIHPQNNNNNNSSSSSMDVITPHLVPLRCPGGPRIKSEGVKHLYKVPHAGFLSKYDHRFILNLKLTHQIASYLSKTTLRTHDKVLVELGPGVGTLTRSLLTRPCVGVLGVEMDGRFQPHLEQIRTYTNGKFQWVQADVLKVNEVELLKQNFPSFVAHNARVRPTPEASASSSSSVEEGGESEGAPLRSAARERILRERRRRGFTAEEMHGGPRPSTSSSSAAFGLTDHWWSAGDAKVEVLANLPFNIISELLLRYCVDCSRKSGVFVFGRVPIHVFTQAEVAERITAAAGSMLFSRLSILCQAFFRVRLKQTFVESTFYPRTEVGGAFLTLEPRTCPLGGEEVDGATLLHFVDLLMKPGQRGMVLMKALQKMAPVEVVHYMLQELRIDGGMTVLDLSVEEMVRLAVLWRNYLAASQQQPSAA